MAARRKKPLDAPGQGRLFGLTPEIKPLDGAGTVRRDKPGSSGEKRPGSGERFVPPINYVEDGHDER